MMVTIGVLLGRVLEAVPASKPRSSAACACRGEFAEKLGPHLSNLDPENVAQAKHALGDSRLAGFPDTEFERG